MSRFDSPGIAQLALLIAAASLLAAHAMLPAGA